MYLDALADMLEERKKRGLNDATGFWKDPESLMRWWVGDYKDVAQGQISIEDLMTDSEG